MFFSFYINGAKWSLAQKVFSLHNTCRRTTIWILILLYSPFLCYSPLQLSQRLNRCNYSMHHFGFGFHSSICFISNSKWDTFVPSLISHRRGTSHFYRYGVFTMLIRRTDGGSRSPACWGDGTACVIKLWGDVLHLVCQSHHVSDAKRAGIQSSHDCRAIRMTC